MASVEIRDNQNKKLEEVQLADEVFGVPRHDHVLHEAVRHHLACRRAGTHATKTRGDVSGGGKKPWRQKGTGRARQGSTRSPLWKGGGTVHGPQPRDYSYPLPRKVKKQAMRVALSEKLREDRLTVVDRLELAEAKTKQFHQLVKSLEVEREALFVDDASNQVLRRAARNHPMAKVVSPSSLNVYDVLRFDRLILSRGALEKLTEIFKP